MDSHGIRYAITADLSGNTEGARSTPKAIEQVKRFGDAFKVLIWINPARDGDFDTAEEAITKYASLAAGMKVHPRTAGIRLEDDRYRPYMELCRKYGIPFVSHTERDGFSNIGYLANWAEMYPDIDFVAVHMELYTDHREAVRRIAQIPNFYGDTTFVAPEDVVHAIETCGPEKILFGSDAPAIGLNSYQALEDLKRILPDTFGREAADLVFFGNARRIFHLDSFV